MSGLYPRPAEQLASLMWPHRIPENRIYCVDGTIGDDNYNGFSWRRPKKTIMAAVNLARYNKGTTTIRTALNTHVVVLVAPGHYNERVAWSGYNVHVIGASAGIPGKDYGVSINYDGALTAGDGYIVAFGGSGNSIRNVHIYDDVALPALHILAGDNNLIQNVVIECSGASPTYGIQAKSMKGSWIRDCVILNPITAGIWMEGGADHYTINGGIERCQIKVATQAGAKGILVDGTMTAYNFRIYQNFIDAVGGGATGIGIDVNCAGNIIVADNYLVVAATATPAEHAGIGMLHNHATIDGTITDPFDDD